jgi:hypothetical protein
MKRILILAWAAVIGLTGLPVAAQEIYLQADFDEKPVDQSIGTGGPEVNEPVEVDTLFIDAIVRETPFPTPALQITDDDDFSAGSVDFQFLDDAEITTGRLVICLDVWVPELPTQASHFVYVREHGSAGNTFANVKFTSDGLVTLYDEGGAVGSIGSYETDSPTRLCLEYDLDASSYDVWLDGEAVHTGEPYELPGAGIGSLLIGVGNDPDTGDSFFIDNLFVGDQWPTPADQETWGRLKQRFQ